MLAGLRSVVGGVRITSRVQNRSSLVAKSPLNVQSRIIGSSRSVQTDSSGTPATTFQVQSEDIESRLASALSVSPEDISTSELKATLDAMRCPPTRTLPSFSKLQLAAWAVTNLSGSSYRQHLRISGFQEICGVAGEVMLAWEATREIDGAPAPFLISRQNFLSDVASYFRFDDDGSGNFGTVSENKFKGFIGALHLDQGRAGTRKLLAPYFHLRIVEEVNNLQLTSPSTSAILSSPTPTPTPVPSPTPTPTPTPIPSPTPTPTPDSAAVPVPTPTPAHALAVTSTPSLALTSTPISSLRLPPADSIPPVPSLDSSSTTAAVLVTSPFLEALSVSPLSTATPLEEIKAAMHRPISTDLELDNETLEAAVFGPYNPQQLSYSRERLQWLGESEMKAVASEVCVVLLPCDYAARMLEKTMVSLTSGLIASKIARGCRVNGKLVSVEQFQAFIGAIFWQKGRRSTRDLLAPYFHAGIMSKLDSLPPIASASTSPDEPSIAPPLPIYPSPSPTSAALLSFAVTSVPAPSVKSQPSPLKSTTAKSTPVVKSVPKAPTPLKPAPVKLALPSAPSSKTKPTTFVKNAPIPAPTPNSSPAPIPAIAASSTPTLAPVTLATPITPAKSKTSLASKSKPAPTPSSSPKATITAATTSSKSSNPSPLPVNPVQPITTAKGKSAPISTSKSTPSKSPTKPATKASKASLPVAKPAVKPIVVSSAKSPTAKPSTAKSPTVKSSKSTPPSTKSSKPAPVPIVKPKVESSPASSTKSKSAIATTSTRNSTSRGSTKTDSKLINSPLMMLKLKEEAERVANEAASLAKASTKSTTTPSSTPAVDGTENRIEEKVDKHGGAVKLPSSVVSASTRNTKLSSTPSLDAAKLRVLQRIKDRIVLGEKELLAIWAAEQNVAVVRPVEEASSTPSSFHQNKLQSGDIEGVRKTKKDVDKLKNMFRSSDKPPTSIKPAKVQRSWAQRSDLGPISSVVADSTMRLIRVPVPKDSSVPSRSKTPSSSASRFSKEADRPSRPEVPATKLPSSAVNLDSSPSTVTSPSTATATSSSTVVMQKSDAAHESP